MILKNYEVVSGFYKWALGKYIELIVKSIIYYWNAKIKKKYIKNKKERKARPQFRSIFDEEEEWWSWWWWLIQTSFFCFSFFFFLFFFFLSFQISLFLSFSVFLRRTHIQIHRHTLLVVVVVIFVLTMFFVGHFLICGIKLLDLLFIIHSSSWSSIK